MTIIECVKKEFEDVIVCNGTTYEKPERPLDYHNMWFWIYLGIYIALVIIAGFMSGLTMALMSMDILNLETLKEAGTPKQQKYAKTIMPLVKRHHLLLVTLLLGNAMAVEAMPIFLDRISDPIVAICVSVSAVLIFGEVIPQAFCTRFGLAIGAIMSPLVYFLMALLFIIAWPLSKLLDCMFGTEHYTLYRRKQLKVLVDLHSECPEAHNSKEQANKQEALTYDEALIIKGAIDMNSKTVKDAMLPMKDVFTLTIDDCMDHATMAKLSAGHSRVPVMDKNQRIIGILLIKNLIILDPDDATPVRDLLNGTAFRKVPHIPMDMPLFTLLNLFQTGKSHLCVVTDQEFPADDTDDCDLLETQSSEKLVGIITLEDVLEELIQEEIIDETDIFVDIQKKIQVARAKVSRQLSNREIKPSDVLPQPVVPAAVAGAAVAPSINTVPQIHEPNIIDDNAGDTSDTKPLLDIS